MTSTEPNAYTQYLQGPSPAGQVALDMVKRGLWVAPLLMLGGAAIWGSDGAWSVGFGVGLILFNFALSAALIAWTSRISLALLMGGVLFGFLIRLAIIFAAVWLVKDMSWVNMVALGVTIIVTHLGLLFWELRYVSASMAHPGLKPKNAKQYKTPVGDKRTVDLRTQSSSFSTSSTIPASPTAPDPQPSGSTKEHSQT